MSAARRRACERCWRRKQKCDKIIPTCTNCAEANAPCAPRSSTYVPAPDHAALAIESGESYINSLKRKIDHLQELQANKHPRLDSTTPFISTSDNDASNHDHAPPRPSDGDNTANTSQVDPMESDCSRETLNEFGSLVLTAMAEPGDHDIITALSTTALLTMETGGLSKANDPISTFLNQSQSDFVFPQEPTAHFLARFQAVFETRYSFEYTGLLNDHALVVSRHDDRERVAGDMAYVFAFVYLAVAIGILVSPESAQQQSLALRLHHAAVTIMSKNDLDQSPFAGLRCILALTIFALYNSDGGCPWRLINIAAQRAVLLGIHRSSPAHGNNATSSRKLFISLYLLERSITSAMHRPFVLQDEDIFSVFSHANDYQSRQRRADSLHLLDQAQLISTIGGKLLFQFSSFRHWEETLPLNFGQVETLDDDTLDPSGQLIQLSCRTLVKISLSDLRGARHCRLQMFENEESLEDQTLSRSKAFARLLHKRLEEETYVPCKLDMYDLLGSCVVCTLLVEGTSCAGHRVLTELLHLTFALLSASIGAFPEAKLFKKVLETVLGLKFSDSELIGIEPADDDSVLSLIDSPGKVPRFVRDALQSLRQESDMRRTWPEAPPFPQNAHRPTAAADGIIIT